MNIARATNDDMRRMFEFFSELGDMLRDSRYAYHVAENKKLGALGAVVKKHWGKVGPGVGASWRRVLYGMDTLLRNCTDPNADTLEWRPDIDEFLKSQAKKKELEATQ